MGKFFSLFMFLMCVSFAVMLAGVLMAIFGGILDLENMKETGSSIGTYGLIGFMIFGVIYGYSAQYSNMKSKKESQNDKTEEGVVK